MLLMMKILGGFALSPALRFRRDHTRLEMASFSADAMCEDNEQVDTMCKNYRCAFIVYKYCRYAKITMFFSSTYA